MLPFTREAFLDIFAAYNDAIWPAQILAYCLGIAALLLVLRGGRGRGADSFIAGSLAAMWVWTGIFYHWGFFARVNDAAYGFGALFLLQGAGLAYAGVMRGRLRFGFRWNGAAWTGLGFVLYAMAIYPILGVLTGHRYPDAPVFGVTPCPVTIFTLGMVLIAARPVPPWLHDHSLALVVHRRKRGLSSRHASGLVAAVQRPGRGLVSLAPEARAARGRISRSQPDRYSRGGRWVRPTSAMSSRVMMPE